MLTEGKECQQSHGLSRLALYLHHDLKGLAHHARNLCRLPGHGPPHGHAKASLSPEIRVLFLLLMMSSPGPLQTAAARDHHESCCPPLAATVRQKALATV